VVAGVVVALLRRPLPRTETPVQEAAVADEAPAPGALPLQRPERRPPSRAEAPSQPAAPRPTAVGLAIFKSMPSKPEEIYNAEKRSPQWASAMEGNLAARFDHAILDELPGFKVDDIECRTSTCRIEVEYPASLPETLIEQGKLKKPGNPLSLVIRRTGQYARFTKLIKDPEVHSGPDGPTKKDSLLLLFGSEEIDPSAYASWARSTATGRAH
jgi:hypothetical protein